MRSDRMMMLMPSRTAPSARAQSSSSTCSIARRAEAGVEGGVERARLEMGVRDIGDRADLFQVRIGQDRLPHFEPLGRGHALQVEQVRPRPDDRDEAHDELLADRIDRRVGDLREILLEVGEQRLRPVRQRGDRRVVAHRARGFFAGRRHRRHQDGDVFLAVAERLLPVEQRQVRAHALDGRVAAIPPARAGCDAASRCRDGSWPASP